MAKIVILDQETERRRNACAHEPSFAETLTSGPPMWRCAHCMKPMTAKEWVGYFVYECGDCHGTGLVDLAGCPCPCPCTGRAAQYYLDEGMAEAERHGA